MDEGKVRPCPFCGRRHEPYRDEAYARPGTMWFLSNEDADDCPLFLFIGPEESREAVLEKWNRRA